MKALRFSQDFADPWEPWNAFKLSVIWYAYKVHRASDGSNADKCCIDYQIQTEMSRGSGHV
jgi:hypothetical protein